ncbi:MAG: DUF1015 domain-containing protein [Bacillota bacterium]
MNKNFCGLGIPEILLPGPGIDLAKWPVVACDQYTSQPEYWEKVSALVGDSPSTLRLIYPEVYLGKEDGSKRIKDIHLRMREYLEENILVSQGAGFVLVDRRTSRVPSRKGLIVALDLECYDYHPGSQTLIRATEGTVLERIPPRVKIREEAAVESPHILVLIDDPERTVIEPVARQASRLKKLYSVDLMMNGGHIEGYQIADAQIIAGIFKSLQALAAAEEFNQKYGLSDQAPLLYAVGDGNHSLATAKAVWEKIKQSNPGIDPDRHPARYALVEMVNIHDPGIKFEPIHRVLFGATPEQLFPAMQEYYRKRGADFRCRPSAVKYLALNLQEKRKENQASHRIGYITGKGGGVIEIGNPAHHLEVGTLQAFLDDYTSKNSAARIDYIHGEDVVIELGSMPGNIGFYLPAMEKSDLFKTVIVDGVLPRKTFSMGEAEEKRFYMECRRIIL